MDKSNRSALLLAGVLVGAGVGHFVLPRAFDSLIPRTLPGSPRTWTYASGVAEIAVGTAVALPRTRKAGGYAAAALLTAVLPGNVTMAHRWRHKPLPLKAAAYARVPLQAPLVLWARDVARKAR